jgi:hypothetical protein
MQSPEETFFAERIAGYCGAAPYGATQPQVGQRALGAIPGAQVNDVHLCKNGTFCCGAGGGCFLERRRKGNQADQSRAVRSEQHRQATDPGGWLPFLYDTDGGRAESRVRWRNRCVCATSRS